MAVGFVLINVSPGVEKKVFDTMIKWDEIEELYLYSRLRPHRKDPGS